jgi:hypothetical protein
MSVVIDGTTGIETPALLVDGVPSSFTDLRLS